MADSQDLPFAPRPGDNEDVELALETAVRLHRTADFAEALKWLRRAVNAADEAGDDRRQLELARAAADYTTFIMERAAESATSEGTASPTPPAVTRTSTAPSRVELLATAADTDELQIDDEEETTAVDVSVARETAIVEASATASRVPTTSAPQAPKAPSIRAAEATLSAATSTSVRPHKSAAPSGGKSRASTVPPGPAPSVAPQRPKISDSPTSEQMKSGGFESHIPLAPKAVSITALGSSARVSSERQSTPPRQQAERIPNPPPAPTRGVSVGTSKQGSAVGVGSSTPSKAAVRVAVRISARDEQLYVVRPLSPGQRLPAGAREAWLTFEEMPGVSAGVVPGKN
jgi:hypothetical protein